MTMFDSANGGFGQAPKFPHPGALDLLIERYARTGDDELRNVFVTTLEQHGPRRCLRSTGWWIPPLLGG